MTTIQDIADKLGISKSAVSKALNNAHCRRTGLYETPAL